MHCVQGDGAYNIASNITKHLTQHDSLFDLQHAFRGKRYYETQLIQFVKDLSRQPTLGLQTDLVHLDSNKAFDKFNYLKLLLKLSNFDINGNPLQWYILNRLKVWIGRSQTVVLDGESAYEVPVTSGLPQGVCTGSAPLSFVHKWLS